MKFSGLHIATKLLVTGYLSPLFVLFLVLSFVFSFFHSSRPFHNMRDMGPLRAYSGQPRVLLISALPNRGVARIFLRFPQT